jgi:hypothetical protein
MGFDSTGFDSMGFDSVSAGLSMKAGRHLRFSSWCVARSILP